MSLFTASSFYLYGDFSECCKEDLKSLIEKNGGKVSSRITTKVCTLTTNSGLPHTYQTTYLVCSGHTKDALDKAKNHNITVLSDSYILDCINAKKRLPTASYTPPSPKKPKKDHADEVGDIYTFAETPDNHNKENHINKLKEKLKQISLSKNDNNKRVKEDDDHNVMISSKKLKQVAKRIDGGDGNPENIPSLKNLVFYLHGQFSIAPNILKNLILENGGQVACAVDDSVTHFLFGGESVDVPEFQEAQKRKIHIVNEYFLRLLVKY